MKTIKRFKIFVDMDREEQYLREMAQKGYMLRKYSVFGVYTFEAAPPQTRNYRVDYRTFSSRRKFDAYVALFEDAGWRHVWGRPYDGSQYFLPAGADTSGDDIFSDADSKAGRYKRLRNVCILTFAVAALYLFTIWRSGPGLEGSLFLTPGLWDKTGGEFWRAFWFELPFVFFRAGLPLLMLAIGAVYGYWAIRAHRIFKRKTAGQGFMSSKN